MDLTAELAEVLRWREMEWSHIPPLSRKLAMPYLGAGDTINLDIAVTNKEDRKHLVKAYVGLRSAGLDGYARYRVDYHGVCLGVKWVQKRSIDLRNFHLEYKGEKEDQDRVLAWLVCDNREELATYFATRCDVRDAICGCTSSTLMMASEHGYLEIVQTLLGRGADVNMSSTDEIGNTPLTLASREGHIDVVRTLLEAGADVSHSNDNGDTALHLASYNRHIEVVRALLEAGAGADIRRANEDGGTPIHLACTGEHIEVFRALVEAGGDVDTPDSGGDTALHAASVYGFTKGVRYLVERGADVNVSSTDEIGDTPLALASWRGYVEVVRALLEAGADVNKRNGRGRSPLFCALKEETWLTEERQQGRAQIVALLREAGAQELQPHELENLE